MIPEHALRDHLSKGDSLTTIGHRYGCTQSNVCYWIKKYKIEFAAPSLMIHDPLHAWIQTHCLTIHQTRIKNICTYHAWWRRHGYTDHLTHILTATASFPDASIPQRIHAVLYGLQHPPLCLHCTQQACVFKGYREGYSTYCSQQCAARSPHRNAKIAQARTPERMERMTDKIKATNKARYGHEWYMSTESFKRTSAQTKQTRHHNPTYNNPIKNQQTCLERYGAPHACQSAIVKEKIQEAVLKRHPQYGDPSWLREQNRTKTITQIAMELGVSYRTVRLWYQKHQIPMNFFRPDYSHLQQTLVEYVRQILPSGTPLYVNDRTAIAPKELDLYLPTHKLGIELNGLYWHAGDRMRHLEKLLRARHAGIQLLQIWDDEWVHHRPIVESMIRARLHCSTTRIYARHCQIHPLTSPIYTTFLLENHLKGPRAASIRYGLYYHGRLVVVMGISKNRYTQSYTHELIRFASALNMSVVGGFSKLFHYIMNMHPSILSLCTFSDNRLFTGASYSKAGFHFSHETPPGYVYVKQNVVYDRLQFQKHTLHKKLPQYDPKLSEADNMNAHGYLQVWDCGQRVFTYHRPGKEGSHGN